MSEPPVTFDSAKFRQVLGHFPTGVTVVTAAADDGPVGLAVGSFASVSLDPPLVAFFPAKNSSSWPMIEAAGAFCVNILAEDQEDVCRRFAMKGDDKFVGLGWKPAPSGAPLLDGVLAWIDCGIDAVTDAGDHYCVMGRVRELAVAHDGAPLLFFRGGYGRFAV
jgi:3-hydroxy-9,10-secoandrosta-1,3,5(10)-triene-9,17-dione monooxygenase reductase component